MVLINITDVVAIRRLAQGTKASQKNTLKKETIRIKQPSLKFDFQPNNDSILENGKKRVEDFSFRHKFCYQRIFCSVYYF